MTLFDPKKNCLLLKSITHVFPRVSPRRVHLGAEGVPVTDAESPFVGQIVGRFFQRLQYGAAILVVPYVVFPGTKNRPAPGI